MTFNNPSLFADSVKRGVFELTRGQPWLVNALARQLVEVVVPDRTQEIQENHLLLAKEILIRRRDTHLDSLLDHLREPQSSQIIEFILTGKIPDADVQGKHFDFVRNMGLVTLGDSGLEITNPIYYEVVSSAFSEGRLGNEPEI